MNILRRYFIRQVQHIYLLGKENSEMSCQNPFWNNLFLNSRPVCVCVCVCNNLFLNSRPLVFCVCVCVCVCVHARVHALSPFSRVRLFATLWTVILHAPQSMGLLQARILEWAATPSSRGFSYPGIKPRSLTCPALQVGSLSLFMLLTWFHVAM